MKSRNLQPSPKITIISFIIPLALQIAFFIFQITHKVITLWNFVATAMMIGLFINAVRMSMPSKKKQVPNDPDLVTGGSTVDHFAQESKPNKKHLIAKIITMIVTLALSIVFFSVYSNKSKGLELVNSKVLNQWGEKTIETEETDDGITQSESEYIEVTVEYEYKGIKKTALIKGGNTSKIYVDELKIYINENGDFVSDYGRVVTWKFEGIIFLCFAIMMLISAIFTLGIEFIASSIFLFGGLAFLLLASGQFFENILFNDISGFISAFINIGFYMFTALILSLIFQKKQIQTPAPLSKEESTKNLKTRLKQKYNKASSDEIKTNDSDAQNNIQCKNCGTIIPSSHKFCTHCGTKKD